jgi:hypothetical protein
VKNYTFNFEVQTLLEQFVGAFNDIIIKRYDNNKTVLPSSSAIKVDFVYAPKQRVYDTLNTPAPGGLTVPVVAVNISGISRDAKRVFNKLEGFFIETGDNFDGSLIKKIPQPVPVNIGINMTIVTKLQSDMDQIVSNFVPYCDPYIIISWKLPNPRNPSNPYEIRSEVLWDGNIQLNYPDNLTANQPYRLTATTNFTIKGWLFKKMDDVVKKIYTIDSKFISNDGTTSENDVVSTKPSIIKDFNTVFGVNQGITVTDFSIQTTAEDIKNFKNTFSTVYGLSGGWEFAYDWVQENSTPINNAVLYIQSNSGIEINQELATNYVIVNSARFEDSYTTVNTLSSDWEMIYTYVTENSGIEINQQAVATLVNTNSSFWDIAYANTPILTSVYSTVQLNSANNWNYQGTDLKSLSSGWVGGNIAYTNLLTNSSAYLSSVDLSFLSLSSNWNSVYTNVNSNSSNWNIAFNFATQYSSNSSFDLAARTFVNSNSSNILQVNTTVNTTSANWNSAYNVATQYQNTSGSFATNTALNAASSVLLPISVYQSASGNWQSTFTTVQVNSATTWNYQGTDLKSLSGNWQSTFGTVNSLSSNWNSAYNNSTVYANNSASYATSSFVNSNFFPLSGGTISGATRINNNLTVFGNLTATGTTTFANTIFSVTSSLSVVHVGSGPALWVGNNGDGDIASFYDLDQGIEVFHVGGNNGSHPNVGVKTSTPNVDFTVNGQISANNIIWDANGNSNNWNSAFNIATTYQNTSGSFATNTLLQSTSALLTPLTLTNTLTSQLVKTTDLNTLSALLLTRTDYSSSSATLLPTSVYQNTSGSFVTTTIGDTRYSKLSSQVYKFGSGTNSIQPISGNNIASGNYSFIAGGQNNNTNDKDNTFILGSDITAPEPNYTYVNNLSSQGIGSVSKGLVVGSELGNYVNSGNHKMQIVATNTQTPLMIQGGSGAIELWADSAPNAAVSFGTAVPGNIGTNDFVFAKYNSGWSETVRIQSSTGNVGIGIASPQRKFHQEGGKFLVNSTEGSWGQFQITNPNEAEVSFVFGAGATINNDGTFTTTDPYKTWAFGAGTFGVSPTIFTIGNNGSGGVLFALDSSTSNVGIGTSTPAAKLDVNGNVYFGDQAGTYVNTIASGSSPEIDFGVSGQRKMVFGYDSSVSRGIFYSDVLGGGIFYYDSDGIAIGSNTNTYNGNILKIPNTWDQVNIDGLITATDGNSTQWNTAYNTATAYQNISGSFVTNTLLQSTSALLTPLTLTSTLTGLLVKTTDLNSLSATLLTRTDFNTASSTFLTDAPSNGSQYARQNGAWTVVVTTSGGGGGSSAYSIVDTNFSALVNQKYLVDTTSISIVGTLPSSPTLGDNILFVDSYNNWGSRPLILNNNGNLLQTFNEPLTANISGYQFQLVYVGGLYGWKIV